MKRMIATTALLLVAGMADAAWAPASSYTIYFQNDSGPAGTGSFAYELCLDPDNRPDCPALQFRAHFEPNLVFDIDHEGGAATYLNTVFLDPPSTTGTNFQSYDYLGSPKNNIALLSFEADHTYCVRTQAIASGVCKDDPGTFGMGIWSIQPVPLPGTLALFISGLVALALTNRPKKFS